MPEIKAWCIAVFEVVDEEGRVKVWFSKGLVDGVVCLVLVDNRSKDPMSL